MIYGIKPNTTVVKGFIGSDFIFLSNSFLLKSAVYNKPLIIDGIEYITVEHAIQAARTLSKKQRKLISQIPSSMQAKLYGVSLKKQGLERPDWPNIRANVMLKLLKLKFCPERRPYLADKLHATKTCVLLNTEDYVFKPGPEVVKKYDIYWGQHDDRGENMLGKLLMKVRQYNQQNFKM